MIVTYINVHGFLACLAAFSVMVVRSEEAENGIRVFDSNGNAIGVSKKAGSKVSVQPKLQIACFC